MSLAVVDASVAIKWAIPEQGQTKSLELLNASLENRLDLLAPKLWLSEIASVLSKQCRRKLLTQDQALRAFVILNASPVSLIDDDIPAALQLSLQHAISLWDAVYLALAIERRCDFLTFDERLYRATSRIYPYVRLLSGVAN